MRPILHPRTGTLAEFSAGELPLDRQERTADHLRRCTRCQDTLRFFRRVNDEARQLPDVELPHALLERVLAQREAGERAILSAALSPTGDRQPRRTATSRYRWAAAAAAVLMAALLTTVVRTPELSALAQESEIIITPERPPLAETVRVQYRPAPGMFDGEAEVVLRARMRTMRDGMYNDHLPVRTVAMLRRTDANSFEGVLRLPEGVVYVALAVEDTAARRIDTHSGRLWEIIVHGEGDRPLLEALVQRVNDMMGRSWEEGYATARRLTELYPRAMESWELRALFEMALLGEQSAEHQRSATWMRDFATVARSAAMLREDEIGRFVFQAWHRMSSGGTAADSSAFTYWWSRLQREHPRHPQVAQLLAVQIGDRYRERPRVVLDSLERAYARLAPLIGPGRNLPLVALHAANRVGDDAASRMWMERWQAGQPDSAYQLALFLTDRPRYRAEGMAQLRTFMAASPEDLAPVRGLDETHAEHQRRADDVRRQVASALGRALIAEGRVTAGRDTLLLAVDGAWNLELFREIAEAFETVGDSSQALALATKVAVDPRTSEAERDSVATIVRAQLGENAWSTMSQQARLEMYQRLLSRSRNEAPRGIARVTSDGRERTLREVTGRVPAVIILWSRNCAAAVEALGRIQHTGAQLITRGTPVLLVVDEPPSVELDRMLRERGVTMPLHHDVDGSTRSALSSFGTPAYYVLDAAGRIRFDGVQTEAELLAQVEALRQEALLSAR